jgi:hypothetical protein
MHPYRSRIQHFPISLDLLHWQIRVTLLQRHGPGKKKMNRPLSEDSPGFQLLRLLRSTQLVTRMSDRSDVLFG